MNHPEPNAPDPSSNERPANHQHLIAMMKEFTPPPADADTPEIPDDLLRRLREQYDQTADGSKVQPIIPMELPAEIEEGESETVQGRVSTADRVTATMPSRVRRPFPTTTFAIAAGALILGLIAALWHSPSSQDDLLRGGTTKPGEVAAYWTSPTLPVPTGIGLPKFIVADQPPRQGNAIICDPMKRSAELIRADGKPGASIQISDPTDSDEWLSAIQQLKTQLSTP